MEEIGCPARIDRLLWVLENFFHHNGLVYHEIGFFYLVNFPDGSPVLTYKSPFTGAEGNEFLTYEWIALNSLDQCKLYPQFLVHRLVSLPEHTEHVIVNELE